MFALASQKKTIVAEALTRVDEHFAGGEAISEFVTIIGDYADFCDIRIQRQYVFKNALDSCCDEPIQQDGYALNFHYLGTNVEVVETRSAYQDGENLNYEILDSSDRVCEMKLWWVRKNPSGRVVGRYVTPEFHFTAGNFGMIADRIMVAIEKNARCEFCGVLLDIYQSYVPIHMCNACAMTENSEPCKCCGLTTGRIEDVTGAHRECKRRRLN